MLFLKNLVFLCVIFFAVQSCSKVEGNILPESNENPKNPIKENPESNNKGDSASDSDAAGGENLSLASRLVPKVDGEEDDKEYDDEEEDEYDEDEDDDEDDEGPKKIKIEPNVVAFQSVVNFVKQFYYDNEKITDNEILENAAKGFIRKLDPHSSYLTKDEYTRITQSIDGQFEGVGIVISTKDNFIYVISPIEGTPAYKAGMKAGDYITYINKKSTFNITIEEASRLLKGKRGTRVKIVVSRKGEPKSLVFKIRRQNIKVKSVKHIYHKKDGLLYLRIGSFIDNTSEDIRAVFSKLASAKKPINGIVLDMRNNPGGILDQSSIISDMFLDKGVITIIKSRHIENSESKITEATLIDASCNDCDDKIKIAPHKEGISIEAQKAVIVPTNVPMVVLINSGSASASEIVSAALQENERAILVGSKTFGKGSVQNLIPLFKTDERKEVAGAIKITTSKYYTPKGNSIQTLGVIPDIVIPQAKLSKKKLSNFEKEIKAPREEDLDNHLLNEMLEKERNLGRGKPDDNIESFDRYEDYQLTTALDILKSLSKYQAE